MASLAKALKLEHRGEGRFRGELYESWYQGGGVYGGLQAALFHRAFDAVVPSERRVRKISLQFCAPAIAGPYKLWVREERSGAYVSHLSARLDNEKGTIAIAAATYAKARHTRFDRQTIKLEPPCRQSLSPAPQLPEMPVFSKHFEFRFEHGDPFYPHGEDAVSGYISLRDQKDDHVKGFPFVTCLMDAWPPAFFATLDKPRPTASSDFTIQYFTPPTSEDSFFWYESKTASVEEGYAHEDALLSNEEGELLAKIRQTRVIF